MEVSRASDRPFARGDAARFTGEVSLGSTIADDEGTNLGGDPVDDEETDEGFDGSG